MCVMTRVELIRLSIGTAIQAGLEEGKSDPNFTTAFMMTYSDSKCSANCAFCPQAQGSQSSPHLLSRIGWPSYKIDDFMNVDGMDSRFVRGCIQSLNYPEVVEDVLEIASSFRQKTNLPLSVCIHPLQESDMVRLRDAGVTQIGIAFDACTPELFDRIKGAHQNGPYQWDKHKHALKTALNVFGMGNVTTHLIVGLGETEEEAARFILEMYSLGVTVGLFAFTSIRGTSLENTPQPDMGSYRRLQVLRYLTHNRLLSSEFIHFDVDGRIQFQVETGWLKETLSGGTAFRVSGCEGCNRPYYNERPTGPMYNHPRPLSKAEIEEALSDTGFV